LLIDVRKIEFLDGANFGRDDAENHADVAALLENVDAEAAQAGDAVGHVKLGGFLKLLFLAVRHHAERHGEHFFWCDAGNFADRVSRPSTRRYGWLPTLRCKSEDLFSTAREEDRQCLWPYSVLSFQSSVVSKSKKNARLAHWRK